MKPTSTTSPVSIRHRQIGRKALRGDSLAHALDITAGHSAVRKLRLRAIKPRFIALAFAVIIGLGALGTTTAQLYGSQVAAEQKIVVAEQQAASQAKSKAADECRRKKVEQKAAQIGTLTYDELYDFDACDK